MFKKYNHHVQNLHTHFKSSGIVAFSLIALTLGSGCYRNDLQTIEIKVPMLGSAACADFLQTKLPAKDLENIKSVSADPSTQTVTVTFSARKTALRNIEHHIAALGFDVQGAALKYDGKSSYIIPANPKAKAALSPECR